MLGHKASLNQFKMIRIFSSIFSDDNCMKLEINKRRESRKVTNACKFNNMLFNK